MKIHKRGTGREGKAMSIVLVPVGEIERGLLLVLQNHLEKVVQEEVRIQETVPLPGDAYHPGRGQYACDIILRTVASQANYEADDRVLAIADVDLYIPRLNYIFGLAGDRVAIISLHRLRQSFYYLPEDSALFLRRVLTEAVHELGHTYGCEHCKDHACVMFFSNTISDTDRKGPTYCSRCIGRMQERCAR
jgi:archaemetzincin